jgi:DNA topoisomerase-1
MPAPPKRPVPDVPVTQTCPKCGGPMKLRPGRDGSFFLGCAKYPKCRGTSELSDELRQTIEQLSAG